MALIKRSICTGALAAAALFAWTSPADAQVSFGVGFGVPYVHVGFYGSPFVYNPWYAYPAAQWGPYPYPYPYPYYSDPGTSLRLEVKPKEAEVYVDGFYAGIVDDFDGTFQRLHVPPGEHEITLYLDGYRTVKQQLRLSADKTLKVKYTMEKLGPGELPEPRPTPPPPPPDQGQYATQPPQYQQMPPNEPPIRRGTPRPMPPNAPPPNTVQVQPGAPRMAEGYGTIAIRVQPVDADIMIDGQVWRGPGDRDRMLVDVAEGRHAIEIRKSGYRTYVTEIDVRSGETTPINVSLRGQ